MCLRIGFTDLIRRGDPRAESDLLVSVGSVGGELVVVDGDAGVGVAADDRHLERRGEQTGVRADVEVIDGGVLEHEPGLVGPQREPDDEHSDDDHEDGHQRSDEGLLEPAAVFVAGATLSISRHPALLRDNQLRENSVRMKTH